MDNDKNILYSYNGLYDDKTFEKLISPFSHFFYKYFIIFGTLMNLIFTFVNFGTVDKILSFTICFIIIEIILLILLKFKLSFIVLMIYKRKNKIENKPKQYFIEFYKDYFIWKTADIDVKVKYEDIRRIVETNNDFFLLNNSDNKIYLIEKEHCDLKLFDFIKNKLNPEFLTENDIKEEINKKYKNSNERDIEILNATCILNFYIFIITIYFGNLFFVLFKKEINFIFIVSEILSIISIILCIKCKKKYDKYQKKINYILFLSFLFALMGIVKIFG